MNEFSISSALNRSLAVWFKNFLPFTLLAAVFYAPFGLYTYLLYSGTITGSPLFIGATAGILAALVNLTLSGALVYGTVSQLHGQHASVSRCVAIGLQRSLPVLGVAILAGLAVGGATLLLIVPGLIVNCMLYVAVPAAVIERPGLFGALQRSTDLTRHFRMPIFGLVLLLAIFGGGLGWLLTRVLVTSLSPLSMAWVELGKSALFGSFGAVAQAVVYHDLRVVKEGARTEDLARVFE
jgi:hypothetical protein